MIYRLTDRKRSGSIHTFLAITHLPLARGDILHSSLVVALQKEALARKS